MAATKAARRSQSANKVQRSPKKAASANKVQRGPKKAASAAKGLKTTPTDAPVSAFLASLDEDVRSDCMQLDAWMRSATESPGLMYGKSIVGYGTRTIRYADGREAPWMKLGFSPRKQALTLYGLLASASEEALEALGKHRTGKGCLYIKRLADVDTRALRRLLIAAAK